MTNLQRPESVEPIDLDDLDTWPETLLSAVRKYPPGSVALIEALTNQRIVELLEGRSLRAYHATRLLPHEVESIRTEGLRKLTSELVERKIAEAAAIGAISANDADHFRRESIIGNDKLRLSRVDQISFVLGLDEYRKRPSGSERPLTCWGGEGIYHWSTKSHALGKVGAPAIVVVDLPIKDPAQIKYSNLRHCLPEAARGPSDPDDPDDRRIGELFVSTNVQPSAIVDIWQPGSAFYDQFSHLPRK